MPKDSGRFSPDVNRILYVRNLPFKITNKELYDIFGKYGNIRQIRIGNTKDTKGTAYVVYDQLADAKNACENLSGFSVSGRYLVFCIFSRAEFITSSTAIIYATEAFVNE